MIKVGIYGATGYMGGEALRVLLEHPQVRLSWITSRQETELADPHPNLYDSHLKFIRPEDITPCDVVFMAAPSGVAMETAPQLVQKGMKVIDLGSDFRLEDRAIWEKVYKRKHTSWAHAQKAVYGLTELRRSEVRRTKLVANPGCFASAAILGLAPLVENRLVDLDKITVDGLSGTAGIGAELSRPAHHAEVGNNLIPYNVVDHRHTYEMEQELSRVAGKAVRVHFTPIYVPIIRGVLDVCHAFPKRKMTRAQLLELYQEYYKGEFFVKVYDLPHEKGVSWQYKPYPWVNSVSGTNFNLIGMDVDEERGRVVIFSVLDSIGKGGSHAGVQNMNLMFGMDETLGLTRLGLHPI
ncbi:MAG TPA: N-acetyl-gamma-glutamyl-phosphate reductase [bacterium]|nr:N-acetyl-gamma-glutamyl-phosphate reductase [bacterium]